MSCITEVFYQQQDKRRESDQAYANKPERRKLRAEQRLENINKEWQKEVIDKKNGNTYQSAPSSHRDFAMHAKIMDISEDPAGYVRRTRRASTMKVRPFNPTGTETRSKNYCPCNPIQRASRSVLTWRTHSTNRESGTNGYEQQNGRGRVRTLRRFRFDAERKDHESGRYGIGGGERRRFAFNRWQRICNIVLNE